MSSKASILLKLRAVCLAVPNVIFFQSNNFISEHSFKVNIQSDQTFRRNMKEPERICHKVKLANPKDRQAYMRREQNHIQGTPKIILAKQLQNNYQQIWVDNLKCESVARLKELNSDQLAFSYARTIISACVRLASKYGFFMINQNMIFFNSRREIFAWINSEILDNHVKIYLPSSPEGELSMIRSIITYFKLWLKCDYPYLSQAKKLDELLFRFDQCRGKIPQEFKPRSPERDFLGSRKPSTQFPQGDIAFNRFAGNSLKLPGNNLLMENRSNRDIKSPGKQQEKLVLSMSNKQKNPLRNYQSSQEQQNIKNRTESHNTDHISSDKNAQQTQGHFEHKSFHTINQSTKLSMNQSLGLKSDKYFPNRTTSKKNHPIVQLINSQDESPHEYKQNKILIEDHAHLEEQERERLRRMKESLDGIGEEVNELFFSNIESDGNKEEELKQIEQEFGSLLD